MYSMIAAVKSYLSVFEEITLTEILSLQCFVKSINLGKYSNYVC